MFKYESAVKNYTHNVSQDNQGGEKLVLKGKKRKGSEIKYISLEGNKKGIRSPRSFDSLSGPWCLKGAMSCLVLSFLFPTLFPCFLFLSLSLTHTHTTHTHTHALAL